MKNYEQFVCINLCRFCIYKLIFKLGMKIWADVLFWITLWCYIYILQKLKIKLWGKHVCINLQCFFFKWIFCFSIFFIEAMRFFWASSCEDFLKLIFQNWNLATSTSFLVYVYKFWWDCLRLFFCTGTLFLWKTKQPFMRPYFLFFQNNIVSTVYFSHRFLKIKRK